MPSMTGVLCRNYVQLTQPRRKAAGYRLSSSRKPVYLLPDVDKHSVPDSLYSRYSHHSASGLAGKQRRVYYDVLTRPAVVSRRQRRVATFNADELRSSREASVLKSLSDSNVHVKYHTSRTNRLKTELIKSDVKLYKNICLFNAVANNNSADVVPSTGALGLGLSCDEPACHHREDRNGVTGNIGQAGNRDTQFITISRYSTNSRSLIHIPSDVLGNPESGHSQTNLRRRPVNANGDRWRVRASRRQTITKPVNRGFTGRPVGTDDEEFLEKLRKSYTRRRKAGNGCQPNRVGHWSAASCSDVTGTGLCVVGKSFITVESRRSTANNSHARNTTGEDCEVNSVSQRNQRLDDVHPSQAVVSRSGNCVRLRHTDMTAQSVVPVANSDKENLHVTFDLFQSCGVDANGVRCLGKIHTLNSCCVYNLSPVSTSRVNGPSATRQLGPLTRAVNSGSGNRA